MKTHEKRALFSKAVLKATTCLFLAAGASVSPAFAFPEMTETMGTEIVQQQAVTITGVVKDKSGEPIIGANILEKGLKKLQWEAKERSMLLWLMILNYWMK